MFDELQGHSIYYKGYVANKYCVIIGIYSKDIYNWIVFQFVLEKMTNQSLLPDNFCPVILKKRSVMTGDRLLFQAQITI